MRFCAFDHDKTMLSKIILKGMIMNMDRTAIVNRSKFLGALGVFLTVVLVTWGAVSGNIEAPSEKTVQVELLGSQVKKISDTQAENGPYVKNTGTSPCYVRIRVDVSSEEVALGDMPWGTFEEKMYSPDIERKEEEFWVKSGRYYYYKNTVSGDMLLPGRETPRLFTAVNSPQPLSRVNIGVVTEAMGSENCPTSDKAWEGYIK